jgi:hypothetical protein
LMISRCISPLPSTVLISKTVRFCSFPIIDLNFLFKFSFIDWLERFLCCL